MLLDDLPGNGTHPNTPTKPRMRRGAAEIRAGKGACTAPGNMGRYSEGRQLGCGRKAAARGNGDGRGTWRQLNTEPTSFLSIWGAGSFGRCTHGPRFCCDVRCKGTSAKESLTNGLCRLHALVRLPLCQDAQVY